MQNQHSLDSDSRDQHKGSWRGEGRGQGRCSREVEDQPLRWLTEQKGVWPDDRQDFKGTDRMIISLNTHKEFVHPGVEFAWKEHYPLRSELQ